MKTVRIIRQEDGAVVCSQGQVADNVFTRVRGLLGRSALNPGEGLLIVPCPSIHMFGMKFAIDTVFLTREGVITDMVENIAPGKMFVAKDKCGKPHSALELPVGTVAQHQLAVGQTLLREYF